MKKCPNCGACQECGHAPYTQQPFNPYKVYPYWSVTTPYYVPQYPGTSAPQTTWGGNITWTSNTTGSGYEA